MSDSDKTPLSNKCDILAELWVNYKNDSEFEDFISYNDLGLPLAYLISMEIVPSTDMAEKFVEETWSVFLGALSIEDEGFESLEDVWQRTNR